MNDSPTPSRLPTSLLLALIGIALAMVSQGVLRAADSDSATADVLRGEAAAGDWTHDAPGVRRMITLDDLPKPYASQSANNGPKTVPRPENAWPKAPKGFVVEQLATGLTNPRKIITAPNGDLFLAESNAGRVKVLRQDADGKVKETHVFVEGLHQPFGLAFYPPGGEPQYLYVGDTDAVLRIPYKSGDLQASAQPQKLCDLPGGGHLRGGGHWTRDVVFSPDGQTMYVSVGSHSNVNDDDQEKDRADILRFNPDGTSKSIYASGIRNAVGLAIQPGTGTLWMSTNERDELGDDLVPDYISHVTEGGFYGWPWYYMGNHQDPRHAGAHPELNGKVITPDVLLQSHSASLCITFYTASQFPTRYHNWAFAAEHGSWNRAKRTGYKIIAVPIVDNKATGEYDDFVTGFVTPDGDVWGRPVGVTVDASGALVFTDDGGNCAWRVRYAGEK